eukprot:5303632-Ditylum_brightwellii.AAC.1
MVQKEDFKAEIHAAIAGHVPPNNSIMTQWYANNRHKIERTGAKVPPFIWEYLLKKMTMNRTGSRLPPSKFSVPNKMNYI